MASKIQSTKPSIGNVCFRCNEDGATIKMIGCAHSVHAACLSAIVLSNRQFRGSSCFVPCFGGNNLCQGGISVNPPSDLGPKMGSLASQAKKV